MTVSLRRLAGLTSLPRNLRSLQRSGSGTSSGALVSAMGSPTVNRSRGMLGLLGPIRGSAHGADGDGQRHDEEACDQQDGETGGGRVHGALPALVALAEGL